MEPILCCVCGFPQNSCRLVRLTWNDEIQVIIAKTAKDNDVMICESCIRGIKRMPFSDLEMSAPIG